MHVKLSFDVGQIEGLRRMGRRKNGCLVLLYVLTILLLQLDNGRRGVDCCRESNGREFVWNLNNLQTFK